MTCAHAWLVAVLLILPWPASAQDRYFAPANVLRFADALFDEKDFIRAAVEFERYLTFGNVPDSEAAAVRFKIGLCFRSAEEYGRAVDVFQDVIARFPGSPEAVQSHVQIAYSLFLAGRYQDSTQATAKAATMSDAPEHVAILTSIEGLNLMSERRWLSADRHFKSLPAERLSNALVADMAGIAAEGAQRPKKSAVAAGMMSVLLPGAGRWYAGRRADAVLSMVTFLTTGWQAYRGFDKDGVKSTRGWIYGSLAGFLYVGNVYGSVVAVRIQNEAAESRLLGRAEMSISVSFR